MVQTLSKLQEYEFICLEKKCKSTSDHLQTVMCNITVTCSSYIKKNIWFFYAHITNNITVALQRVINCMCQEGSCSDIIRNVTRQYRNEILYGWTAALNVNSVSFRKQCFYVSHKSVRISVSTWHISSCYQLHSLDLRRTSVYLEPIFEVCFLCLSVCVSVCLSVCERERESSVKFSLPMRDSYTLLHTLSRNKW